MSPSGGVRSRAGRLDLAARLALARHAVELLRSKEEALERERTRAEGHARRTGDVWNERCRDASARLLRARSSGADAEIADLRRSPADPATVSFTWQSAMGVSFPGDVDCRAGARPEVTSTAALPPAIDAYRAALEAGAAHAATTAALERVTAEIGATRRRRRAIERRLEPRLTDELHDLDLHLDEQEREGALRSRLANRNRGNPR